MENGLLRRYKSLAECCSCKLYQFVSNNDTVAVCTQVLWCGPPSRELHLSCVRKKLHYIVEFANNTCTDTQCAGGGGTNKCNIEWARSRKHRVMGIRLTDLRKSKDIIQKKCQNSKLTIIIVILCIFGADMFFHCMIRTVYLSPLVRLLKDYEWVST